MSIIAELRGSLNMQQGGELAQNLSDLYEYMLRQLLRANAENNLGCITEVASLLGESPQRLDRDRPGSAQAPVAAGRPQRLSAAACIALAGRRRE